MDFNRFTEKLQEAVRAAQSIAIQHGNQQLDTEHLLLALLEQEGGLAPSILNKADIRVDALRTRLQQEIDRLPKVSGATGGPDQVYVTPRSTKLLTQAEDEAKRLKDDYVSVEHVLLAATDDSGARQALPRIRHHARAPDAGLAGSPRQPARDHSESGSDLRGSRKIRPRSDQAGRAGQARSGDRAR